MVVTGTQKELRMPQVEKCGHHQTEADLGEWVKWQQYILCSRLLLLCLCFSKPKVVFSQSLYFIIYLLWDTLATPKFCSLAGLNHPLNHFASHQHTCATTLNRSQSWLLASWRSGLKGITQCQSGAAGGGTLVWLTNAATSVLPQFLCKLLFWMNLGNAEIKQRVRKYEKEDAERKKSFLVSPIDARIWGRERVTAKNKENFYSCFSGENYIWAFECAEPLDPEPSCHRTYCPYKMDPLAWHLKNLIENDSKKKFYIFIQHFASNEWFCTTYLAWQTALRKLKNTEARRSQRE